MEILPIVHGFAAGCVATGLFLAGHSAKKGESPSFMLKWSGLFFLVFALTM